MNELKESFERPEAAFYAFRAPNVMVTFKRPHVNIKLTVPN